MNDRNNISQISPRVVEFAEFSFDAAKKILWRGSETVTLSPKACEILSVLIENAPEVLSREELMNRVWNDSFVEEANLTHHISALRKALNQEKNGKYKFIETIPRKGYRFVATITEVNKGLAEITISEKVSARAVEEIEIETNENRVNESGLRDSISPERLVEQRNYRKSVYVFGSLFLVGLLVFAAYFGNRYFSGKSKETVILPSAIVPQRIAPNVDAVSPTISPDGKFMAFSWYKNGQSSLWQKNLANGEMNQLTADTLLSESQTFYLKYSPDGQWIYYILNNYKEKSAELYRITATGGNPQRITENINEINGGFGFSPDGKKIAYVFRNNMNTALVIADAETGKSYPIAERNDGFKTFGNSLGVSPSWSPDGKRIVVSGINESGNRRIYELIEVDTETGIEKNIPISENLRIFEVDWLADGSSLMANVSEATGVPKQIAHISYPDGKITILTNDDYGYDFISLTKDSRTMMAGKDVGSLNIWTADAKKLDQRKQITIGGIALQGNNSMAFASDGRIIFSSPQNGSTDLWSVTSDGSGLKQLTKNTGKFNAVSAITPDGRYLIFNSIRSGTNQTWRMDADGGNPVQLSNTGRQAFDEQLSPDGRWIYFTSFLPDNFVQQVYKVSIDGGESIPVTDRNYYASPRFSPDGKLMIFTGKDENNQPLRTCIIETATGKTIVPPEKFNNGVWANDSRHLINMRAAGQELWQYDVYADKYEKIADFKPSTFYKFAISPDGQKYAFSLGNISSEAVLFTNYLSN